MTLTRDQLLKNIAYYTCIVYENIKLENFYCAFYNYGELKTYFKMMKKHLTFEETDNLNEYFRKVVKAFDTKVFPQDIDYTTASKEISQTLCLLFQKERG